MKREREENNINDNNIHYAGEKQKGKLNTKIEWNILQQF